MGCSDLKDRVDKIINDSSQTIDERLESVLGLSRSGSADGDDAIAYADDVIIYSSLIKMLVEYCGDHSRDLTLMQLYVLLAETYVEMDAYRPLGDVASGVLRLMRDEMTSAEIYLETIPRLASAIGHSVYNHALYEILLRYVRCILGENPAEKAVKPQAKQLLKLQILLDDPGWCSRMWSKDLQSSVAGLFTSDELVNIIISPKIGHLKRDPVEYTWEWENIYYDLESELDERFRSAPRHHGLCFHIWNVKRELLEDRYGIKWRSPAQMNPGVRFD